MSLCDFKLQVVHDDLSWKKDPYGLVEKAEQTVHFLKEAEAPSWITLGVGCCSSADWLQNILSAEKRIISCSPPFLEAPATPGDPATNISCLTC